MRILAALLFFSYVCFGQGTEAKNCSVDGTVVNSVTGAPILRAHVSLSAGGESSFTESDAEGKWQLGHLPPIVSRDHAICKSNDAVRVCKNNVDRSMKNSTCIILCRSDRGRHHN